MKGVAVGRGGESESSHKPVPYQYQSATAYAEVRMPER